MPAPGGSFKGSGMDSRGYAGGMDRDPRGAGGRQIDMRDYLGGGGFNYNGQRTNRSAFDMEARDWASRQVDAQDLNESRWGRLGNRLASAFGWREEAGAFNPHSPTGMTRAQDYMDPAGLIGGLGGMALGIPGLGIATGGLSRLLGRPLEFAYGGGASSIPGVQAAGQPHYGGFGPNNYLRSAILG